MKGKLLATLVVTRDPETGVCETKWYDVTSRHEVNKMLQNATKRLRNSLYKGFYADAAEPKTTEKGRTKECQKKTKDQAQVETQAVKVEKKGQVQAVK